MTFDTPIRSHTAAWWHELNDMERDIEVSKTPAPSIDETQQIHARAVAASVGEAYLRRAVLYIAIPKDEQPIRLSVRQAGWNNKWRTK